MPQPPRPPRHSRRAGDDYVDVGGEGGWARLEVRASRRVPVPKPLTLANDESTSSGRGQGARQDANDYVPRGGTIPVGKTTGHVFITLTDDNDAERAEYQRMKLAGLDTEVTVRITDKDPLYVQVIDNNLTLSQGFGVDMVAVYCAVGGQRFTGNPVWARPDFYQGASVLAVPSQVDLAEVGGIVLMVPATPTYTWDHDSDSNTPQVPYLAFDEWDLDRVFQHPQGFDAQMGGHADADCSVDFGGQPQRN